MSRAPEPEGSRYGIEELANHFKHRPDVIHGALRRAGVHVDTDGFAEISPQLYDALGEWVEVELKARTMERKETDGSGDMAEAPAENGAPVKGDEDAPMANAEGAADVRQPRNSAIVIAVTNAPDLPHNSRAEEGARAWKSLMDGAMDELGQAPLVIRLIDENKEINEGWVAAEETRQREIAEGWRLKNTLMYLATFAKADDAGELRVINPEGGEEPLHEFYSDILENPSIESATIFLSLFFTQKLSEFDLKRIRALELKNPRDLPWTLIISLAPLTIAPATGIDPFTQVLISGMGGAALDAKGHITGLSLAEYALKQVPLVAPANQVVAFHHKEAVLDAFCAPGVVRSTNENVGTHPDQAATVDMLGRAAFAEVLGQRIRQAREREEIKDGAFMVHLHGPWGSGKSSVLNFLRADLEEGGWKQERARTCKRRKDMSALQVLRDRWAAFTSRCMQRATDADAVDARRAGAYVVVDFNAWRHQRVRPPWWSLLQVTAREGAEQLSWWDRQVFGAKWLLYKVWADLVLVLGVIALIGITFYGYVHWSQPADGTANPSLLENTFKILSPLLTIGATIFAWNRSLFFGDSRSAKAATEMRTDVLRPVVALFKRLVNAVRRPMIIFIDDLDRCDQNYVVELLEGVQTLFKEAPVTFLVAADRNWIRTSYEEGYGKFKDTIGGPGRPLGHLFLEKMFQLSVAIPRLSPAVVERFMDDLLRSGHTGKKEEVAQKVREERLKVREQMQSMTSPAQVKALIERARDPIAAQAIAEESALSTTAQKAVLEAENRMKKFAPLLEPNPRSMKRLLNAYGMNQAAMRLERRYPDPDALARWTLLEMRWPLLADHLTQQPDSLRHMGKADLPNTIPAILAGLFTDAQVQRVLGNGSLVGDPQGVLDSTHLEVIMGNARTSSSHIATAASGSGNPAPE